MSEQQEHRPDDRYAYVADELVVGIEHERLVMAELERLQVGYSKAKSSEALGLVLLTLTDVENAAAAISGGVGESDIDPDMLGSTRRPGDPLDQALWGLHQLFGARYAGWSPVLGKNRLVGPVYGNGVVSHGGQSQGVGRASTTGVVSHGGGGDPEPVGPPPSPGARASGPGSGVRVGVLDTGLYPQSWLAGGWVARYSDTISDTETSPYAKGHATFLTGLVLSQAPGATVEVRRVLDDDGNADSWTVAEEIVQFGRSGLDVLNLSFACYTEDGAPPLVLATAVDRLPPELVVVAAAGNHGELGANAANRKARQQGLKPAWPAALDDVIAVGAAKDDGSRATFSPDAPWIDIHARGVALCSTYLAKAGDRSVEFGGWARWSGTSFAAALVSGAIAAATVPNRVSSREAARDILDTLAKNALEPVGRTHAKFLPSRIWAE